jgi:hypothetical protein
VFSSDVEMVDPDHSDSKPESLQRIRVATDVAAAYKRGSKKVNVKSKQNIWKPHENNQRTFVKP